jgi:hypothetical protein
MIAQVHEHDEVAICNMYMRGITRSQFERMLSPKCGLRLKIKIMAAVDNAIQKMEKHKKIKATCRPADQTQSAPDGAASGGEKISDLREALRTGTPHPDILNLRRVTPKVGQKVQVTCQTHSAYWSPPGQGTPNKVREPPYKDAAMFGKQHVVLGLREGRIGNAWYYAVRIDISTDEERSARIQRLAYLNYRLRHFRWGASGSTTQANWAWSSDYNHNWWCETLVGDEYFNASKQDVGNRPIWTNDRRNNRVLENIIFVPVGHNPDAIWDHKHLSKTAVTRLRHGDSKQFINGVGMDIENFVEFMTKQCKWVEHTNAYQNRGRYRASEFDTEDYAC